MTEQMTLSYGRARAQEGIERMTKKAGEAWLNLAFAYVELYVQNLRTGAEFTAEMLVEASVAHGIIQPHNDKAWSAPVLRAKRAGLIAKCDKPGVCRKRHASTCVLWRKV